MDSIKRDGPGATHASYICECHFPGYSDINTAVYCRFINITKYNNVAVGTPVGLNSSHQIQGANSGSLLSPSVDHLSGSCHVSLFFFSFCRGPVGIVSSMFDSRHPNPRNPTPGHGYHQVSTIWSGFMPR